MPCISGGVQLKDKWKFRSVASLSWYPADQCCITNTRGRGNLENDQNWSTKADAETELPDAIKDETEYEKDLHRRSEAKRISEERSNVDIPCQHG